MKSKIVKVVLTFFLLSVISGCDSRENLLKGSGLFGGHPLLRMENFGAVNGSVSGSFFLGTGSINGTLGSEFKIQFYWSPKPGEIIISALPYSKFRFIIDETKDTPEVEFVFGEAWLKNPQPTSWLKVPSNLNNLIIGSDYLELARVRISSAAMEKEVYLPKVR